eukprot:CAMPEP_0206163390 /NCGR_PEP_ID=MMETSP1474-20131121/11382_1 /ASSEMBLY_ACC=CAM_ASM_001110 /TAXON_ID=97495 /ORGANISM="Imantonia sp., Strain RCC918" /LENGTH=206 /DNA_ID=CAMNT_0053565879 /DNA_START=28 /DNA_END=648 /DNA_ORIENTATION=-
MALPVLLYVPNLIGYLRVVLALAGYYYALADHRVTVGCYFVSQILDAADGYAARKLGQSSSFGAVLDMVTDRASTTCLCIVLGRLYPDLVFTFTCLVMLDMFSHWYQMYATLKMGLGSHKDVTNPILRFYYWKPVLFLSCAGTELWYMAMYVSHFDPNPLVGTALLVALPVCAFKQVANVVQLVVAANTIVEHDQQLADAASRKAS